MLDPSEADRLVHLTGLPLMRLVDWKNRAGEPFEMRCKPGENGVFAIDLNTPMPTHILAAVPVVHGEYESRREEDGTLVYKSLPGNSMGQVVANDGRPAFGVAFDITELDKDGRAVMKVYFGTTTEWFVKNNYHKLWNELRDVKNELEPEPAKPQSSEPELSGKERGRNPRDRARNEQRGGGGGGYGGGGGGGDRGRTRRGRRGGRGRGRGGGGGGGSSQG